MTTQNLGHVDLSFITGWKHFLKGKFALNDFQRYSKEHLEDIFGKEAVSLLEVILKKNNMSLKEAGIEVHPPDQVLMLGLDIYYLRGLYDHKITTVSALSTISKEELIAKTNFTQNHIEHIAEVFSTLKIEHNLK